MFLMCKEGSETKAVLCKDSFGNKSLNNSIIHMVPNLATYSPQPRQNTHQQNLV